MPALKPPEPAAQPWHCIDVFRDRSKDTTSYCWISEPICQEVTARKRKRGTRTTSCAAQSLAYCLEFIDPATVGRQLMCTRRRDHCDAVREAILERNIPHTTASNCQAIRNRYTPFDTSSAEFYARGEPD